MTATLLNGYSLACLQAIMGPCGSPASRGYQTFEYKEGSIRVQGDDSMQQA
jgi:hypothetical protein